MSRRDRPSGRQKPSRNTYTILVFCGSERTENDYLEGLRRAVRPDVAVKVRCDGVDPAMLVRHAVDYRSRYPRLFDETWCVVDTDEFDLTRAADEARRNKVQLAVSNPCFELWLLLHHDKYEAYVSSCKEAHLRLRKHVPSYDKTRLRFEDFAAGITEAVDRARQLDPSGEEYARNPSTGVWRLIERIIE